MFSTWPLESYFIKRTIKLDGIHTGGSACAEGAIRTISLSDMIRQTIVRQSVRQVPGAPGATILMCMNEVPWFPLGRSIVIAYGARGRRLWLPISIPVGYPTIAVVNTWFLWFYGPCLGIWISKIRRCYISRFFLSWRYAPGHQVLRKAQKVTVRFYF